MFKKMIFTFGVSMMLLFIIWTCIGYGMYGNELINKHLNLFAMFSRFENTWSNRNIFDLFRTILDTTNDVANMSPISKGLIWITQQIDLPIFNNDIIKYVVQVIAIFFSPFTQLVYSIALVVTTLGIVMEIVLTIVEILVNILTFISEPLFI